jgi:phosphate transport system substrate-binding protein
MTIVRDTRHLIATTLFLFSGMTLAGTTLTGAGSTAAGPIYAVWASNYEKETSIQLKYDAVGSGAGLARIREHRVDFGASDVSPSKADLERDGLIAVPTVVTAAVPVINLPSVGHGQLKLTGNVLAKIFLGQIYNWNANEIQELNKGLKLPDMRIHVVVRSDGSGTTYHFSDYLGKVNADWKSNMGTKSQFKWPEGFILAKGSGEVVKAIKNTSGSIGYVDYNFVLDNGLNFAKLRNSAGSIVEPSVKSIASAVKNSDWFTKGDFSGGITDMPGVDSWPVTMGTYILVPRIATDTQATLGALRFVLWGYVKGDALAQLAKFVPLPDRVQAKSFAEIARVVDAKGNLIGMQALPK